MMPVLSSMPGFFRSPALGTGSVVIETFDKEPAKNEDFNKAHVTKLQNSYPLKLMVPSHASENNSVWVYPITFGGGLVSGDQIEMTFHVKNNCCAVVAGQESTKVYHCEDQLITRQTTYGHVEAGGLLCVMSDPIVCYAKSDFVQYQEFKMSSAGSLVYLDWTIGGRAALQELWHLHSYQNKTDVYIDEKLVFRDNYFLQDTDHVSILDSMKNMQVLGSCIILGNQLKPVTTQLNNILNKKKSIGERYSTEFTCSVSPLTYNTETPSQTVTGLYIRFMAVSSSKAYEEVISHIVNELEPYIGGNPFSDKY